MAGITNVNFMRILMKSEDKIKINFTLTQKNICFFFLKIDIHVIFSIVF